VSGAKQPFNCLKILYVLRTTVIINNFLVKVDLEITRRIIGRTLRNQFGAYTARAKAAFRGGVKLNKCLDSGINKYFFLPEKFPCGF